MLDHFRLDFTWIDSAGAVPSIRRCSTRTWAVDTPEAARQARAAIDVLIAAGIAGRVQVAIQPANRPGDALYGDFCASSEADGSIGHDQAAQNP